jgi:hypothetical protein
MDLERGVRVMESLEVAMVATEYLTKYAALRAA